MLFYNQRIERSVISRIWSVGIKMRTSEDKLSRKKVMIPKRVAKYYHSDGNGIHLEVGGIYFAISENGKFKFRVLKEYANYYLVIVNECYKTTVNKLHNDFAISD